MARVRSIGMIKGLSRARANLPAEGSKTRLVYDTYYEWRGRPLPRAERFALIQLVKERCDGVSNWSMGRIIDNLSQFYGCDFRQIGGKRVLVGEWFGRIYVDYTLPAQEQAAALSLEEAAAGDIAAARDALLGSRLAGTRAALELG